MIDVKDDLDSFEDQDVYQQRPFVTKRALDKMKYYGGLGKRLSLSELYVKIALCIEISSFFETVKMKPFFVIKRLAERVDEIEDAKRARIAEKKLDKLKYYGGLGKRLDRLRYMGSLGK